MTRRDAERLFAQLRGEMLNVEETVIRIVTTKAWESLGYTSFMEAWAERMRGVGLATELAKVYAIYAALEEGTPRDEVIEGLLIPDSMVDAVAECRSRGLPPEGYSLVREHQRRRNPGPNRVLGVKFSASEFAYLQDIAKAKGFDLKEEAKRAIWEHVGGLLRG